MRVCIDIPSRKDRDVVKIKLPSPAIGYKVDVGEVKLYYTVERRFMANSNEFYGADRELEVEYLVSVSEYYYQVNGNYVGRGLLLSARYEADDMEDTSVLRIYLLRLAEYLEKHGKDDFDRVVGETLRLFYEPFDLWRRRKTLVRAVSVLMKRFDKSDVEVRLL